MVKPHDPWLMYVVDAYDWYKYMADACGCMHDWNAWLLHVIVTCDWWFYLASMFGIWGWYSCLLCMVITGAWCSWLVIPGWCLPLLPEFGIHGWFAWLASVGPRGWYPQLLCMVGPLSSLSSTFAHWFFTHSWAMILLVMSLYTDVPFIFISKLQQLIFPPNLDVVGNTCFSTYD